MSAIYEFAAKDAFELLATSPGAALSVSFFELSGDRCCDMLNQFESAQLMTGRDGSVHAFPLVEIVVKSADDLIALINHGRAVRSTASTGVNDTSSRSHAILRIYISLSGSAGGLDEGVLTLVDLAGSEHRIDSMYHGAERRKEGAVINASLMALKECVRARASGKNFSHQYRKNKLTMALKSSFMLPTARTVIIATVSPASKDTEHSLNTLRHACIMDGQQASGDEDEARFVTGGVKQVELVGEVNVSGISRQRRSDAKAGDSGKNEAKVSNGNEARPNEVILSDEEKSRQRRAAEKKAFAKLTSSQKALLLKGRNMIGRNRAQEARLSRISAVDVQVLNEFDSGEELVGNNERKQTVSGLEDRPKSAGIKPSLYIADYSNSRTDRPTEQQNNRLIQMGLKSAGDDMNYRASKVYNSPPQAALAGRPTSPLRRSELIPHAVSGATEISDRVVSSPISRPHGAPFPEERLEKSENVNESLVRITMGKLMEFKRLQASMFAQKDVPFEAIKRQFVDALKKKGYTNTEIKALVIAETGGGSLIIVSEDVLNPPRADFTADDKAAVIAPAAPAPVKPPFTVSKDKVNTFNKLKASVFHGADDGTPKDIIVRQLMALMKQKEFTRAEMSFLLKDIMPVATAEHQETEKSPLRNSASAGSIRRSIAKDMVNQSEKGECVEAQTADRRKPTRLSRRSMLWRPSDDTPDLPPPRSESLAEHSNNKGPQSKPSASDDRPVAYRSPYNEKDSEIINLEVQIANPSISEATKFGLKKRLAALKATQLRAERKAEQDERELARREQLSKAATPPTAIQHLSSQRMSEGPAKMPSDERRPPSSQRKNAAQQGKQINDSSVRVQINPPQHLESIKQPDMLDKYAVQFTSQTNQSVVPKQLQNANRPMMQAAAIQQHYSSPPSAYLSSERDSTTVDLPITSAGGGKKKSSYIGAVSAPFANEMNWNLYT